MKIQDVLRRVADMMDSGPESMTDQMPNQAKMAAVDVDHKDGTAPETTTQKKCTIYTTFTDNKNKLDSCDNIRQRDLFKCPGGQAAVLTSTNSNLPVLVQCTFSSSVTPQPLICYSDASYLEHLKVGSPDWRGTLTKDAKLAFCSNAQRYYLDRSLNDTDLNRLEGPYV